MKSKALSMKKLYMWAADFLTQDLKSHENLQVTEQKKAAINEFIRFVWDNRNN